MIELNNLPQGELDQTIAVVEVWYDVQTFKTWCVTCYNATEDQVGDTQYTHFKSNAVYMGKELADEHNATLKVGKRNG